MQQVCNPSVVAEPVPEAKYAYYRRCQVFRKNGEQCKAPAERGASICYAHAQQQAMALRRERERQAVLAEAVAEIRGKGNPKFEMADLFMDFKSIQITLAATARALMNDRIDCKTAGRLIVDLQTVSKLLRMKTKDLPLINTGNTDLKNRAMEGKPNLTVAEHQSQQSRAGLVGHEGETGWRTKVMTRSAGNSASTGNAQTGNAQIVAISSAERVPNASRLFFRHDSRPTLLTG